MNNNSHKTAITRSQLSAPMAKLFTTGLLKCRVLDWGCGKGDDFNRLRYIHNIPILGYDPYYAPDLPNGWFDTITCIYVLNVIPDLQERRTVINQAMHKLAPNGRLYVAIRRGKDLKGWTKLGTWQGYVGDDLPICGMSLLHRQSDYEIWSMLR